MFKQLLGVDDICDVERHSCEMGCTGWPVTPQKEWQNCRDDKCAKCGGKRFKTVMGRLVPVRVRPEPCALSLDLPAAATQLFHACMPVLTPSLAERD